MITDSSHLDNYHYIDLGKLNMFNVGENPLKVTLCTDTLYTYNYYTPHHTLCVGG